MLRTVIALLILGALTGDGLLFVIVAAKLFAQRARSKTFLYLAGLFACLAVHLLLFIVLLNDIPKPRTPGTVLLILSTLSVLALGGWPASLHFVVMKAGEGDHRLTPSRKSTWIALVTGLCGAIAFVLGSLSLYGYLGHISEFYLWQPGGDAMALNTAIGLTATGVGMIAVAYWIYIHGR